MASRFVRRADDIEEVGEDMDELVAFLAYAALEAGEGQAQAGEEGVQLMTLHSAKGLEFPLVFLAGLEEACSPAHARWRKAGGWKKSAAWPMSASPARARSWC